ncbi:MAG: hypothetical protein QXJ62_03635 [Nitrososphaeria archaeon]
MDLDERIDFYCRLYEKVYKKVLERNSGDVLAVGLKVFEEVAKDLRSGVSHKELKQKRLASERQREALHKFGVKKIPENLSAKEASEILGKLIGFSKASDKASWRR